MYFSTHKFIYSIFSFLFCLGPSIFFQKGKVPSFRPPSAHFVFSSSFDARSTTRPTAYFFTNKSFLGILFSLELLNENNREGQPDDRMSKQSEPFSCNVGVPIFQYYDDGDCIDCFHCNRQSYFFLGPFVFLSCILLFPFQCFRRENEAKG